MLVNNIWTLNGINQLHAQEFKDFCCEINQGKLTLIVLIDFIVLTVDKFTRYISSNNQNEGAKREKKVHLIYI